MPSKRTNTPAPAFAPSDAVKRFIASMTMTFDMWHDGTSYDLAALDHLTPADRESLTAILITHTPRDWRDIEALACLDTPAAQAEIKAALQHEDPKVRREAVKHAGDQADPLDREARLIAALQVAAPFGGLTEALDEATEFHPPAVMDALFFATLNGPGDSAVHFAALLFYLHGKAKEPFAWKHRPFYLRFNTQVPDERKAAFIELCDKVGVDPAKYLANFTLTP